MAQAVGTNTDAPTAPTDTVVSGFCFPLFPVDHGIGESYARCRRKLIHQEETQKKSIM